MAKDGDTVAGAGATPVQKVRREMHRYAEARHLYWYVAAVAAILLILIGAGFMFGRALLVGTPSRDAAANATAQTPPGYFIRRLPDGKTCRFTVFDHNRGEAIEDRIGRCEEFQPQATTTQQRAKTFNWGGK